MKKTLLTSLLCVAMAVTLMAGCGSKAESKDSKKPEKKSSVETTVDVESATASQVEEFLSDSDENTMLVDARPQEAYSGWALEGAANGGHLKDAALFSARWLDCEYSESASREAYLERALKDRSASMADASVFATFAVTPLAEKYATNFLLIMNSSVSYI